MKNEKISNESTSIFSDAFSEKWYKGKSSPVPKHTYYVVFKGVEPGIYDEWEFAEKQVKGFSGAKYKAYNNWVDAVNALKQWLDGTKTDVGSKKSDEPKSLPLF